MLASPAMRARTTTNRSSRSRHPGRPGSEHAAFESWKLPEAWPLVVVDWTMDRPRQGHFHLHDALEIGWCHSGTGILIIEGTTHAFGPGDVTLIPPLVSHTGFGAAGPSRWTFAFLDHRRLLPASADARLRALARGTVFTPKLHARICDLGRTLIEEAAARRDLHRDAVAASLAAFVVESVRAAPRADRISADGDRDRGTRSVERMRVIAPALKAMAERHGEPLSITGLAHACRLSPAQFRRIFVDQMGVAPKQHLLALRVEIAASRLVASDDGIAAIALAAGFDSLSAFNRQFARRQGCSPREWRARTRG